MRDYCYIDFQFNEALPKTWYFYRHKSIYRYHSALHKPPHTIHQVPRPTLRDGKVWTGSPEAMRKAGIHIYPRIQSLLFQKLPQEQRLVAPRIPTADGEEGFCGYIGVRFEEQGRKALILRWCTIQA